MTGDVAIGDLPDAQKGDDAPYITPKRPSSMLDARERQYREALAGLRSDLDVEIASFTDAIKTIRDQETPDDDPAELEELKAQIAQLEDRADRAEELEALETAARQEESFDNAIKDALIAAGCRDPKIGLRVVRPDVSESDGSGIIATVKSDYGEEDITLDAYLEKLKHDAPGLFSDSRSDKSTSSGKSFKYTKEQVFDAKNYIENRDEYLEQGQVQGLKLARRPRSGATIDAEEYLRDPDAARARIERTRQR